MIRVHALIDSLDGGGAERLLAEQARSAAAAGIVLSVGCLGATGAAAAHLRAAGIEAERVPVASLVGRADRARVLAHLADTAPDVVHTHLEYADILGAPAARALGLPAVSTVHAGVWDRGPRPRAVAWLAARARRVACARVVTVSSAARAAYLARGWDTAERVVAVPNGIVASPVPGAGRALRRELGIAPGAPVVTMLSRLRPEKNHVTGLAAIALLTRSHPGLRVLVVGEGPEEGAVRRAAATLGGDTAILTGHRDDVMAVLDATDVLLHPSTADALPTALIEAMAARTPIVASAVGGIGELLDGGGAGALVPAPATPEALAAAIGELLARPAYRADLAERGRRRYEARFTGARWAAALRGVYETVLAGTTRGAAEIARGPGAST